MSIDSPSSSKTPIVNELQPSSENVLDISVNTVDSCSVTRTQHLGGQKMSSTLKERLKRVSRVQSSPLSSLTGSNVNLRARTNCKLESSVSDVYESKKTYPKEEIEKCDDKSSLIEIYSNLQKEVFYKEEKLRKLKLVQKHHTKNTPKALDKLTQRWLNSAQNALIRLYEIAPEPKPVTFKDFLIWLQIDFQALQFDAESEAFL